MNWKWGIAFGIMVFITLISMAYSFVQMVKAQAAEQELLNQTEIVNRISRERDMSMAEADKQHMLFMESQKELDLCRTKLK